MANNLAQRVTQNNAAQRDTSGVVSIQDRIRQMEQQFQLAMPRGAEATQLIRDALTVLRANPKLAECDQQSVLGALMTCAQLGLRPGIGALGHAHILPFYSTKKRGYEAQFILGYQGMLELAQRSGQIASISARVVYENETFDVSYGLDEKLEHKPVLFGDKGAAIGYYATVHFKNGGHTFIFANKQEIEAHRDKFATAKNKHGTIFGPWVDHFDAMAQKTVLRELFKFMPKSTEIQNALVADESVRVNYTPTADLNDVATSAGDVVEGETVDTTTGEIADPEPVEPNMDDPWETPAEGAK